MKNILAIIASPRKLGNSELMVKEIARHIEEPHRLRLLRLQDYDIRHCRGCYTCLFTNRCVIDDEFSAASRAVLDADALIVAAPTYFLGPNASLKCFTDRGISLFSHVERMWGKPAVAVGIAGIKGKEGYTLLGLESFLKMVFADIKARRMVYGALPGEVFMNAQNRETAEILARTLFGDAADDGIPSCPVCGGQTFRMLADDRARCMLCSNSGGIDTRDGRPVFHIAGSDHELFTSLPEALVHRDWLMGMKSRFSENKEQLKRIVLEYRHEGEWLKPPPQKAAG